MVKNSSVELINQEINKELANEQVGRALLATTFKGLNSQSMKQAILEGMIRGFKFNDFLEKNVYAIPFKDGYSLVTSIDFARKRGFRAGIVGKDAPKYVMDGKKIVSCAVTMKRRSGGYIGDYTAEVYFDEYYKAGKNGYPSLWDTKPRTMIAKVAEMHALRMACPEELSQIYTEEELEAENTYKEPVKYEVPRIIPAADDEGQGRRVQPVVELVAEIVMDPVELPKDEPVVQTSPEAESKMLKVEIAALLKAKANFVALGKKDEAIEEKIMSMTGIAYIPENYKAIIEELKGFAEYK